MICWDPHGRVCREVLICVRKFQLDLVAMGWEKMEIALRSPTYELTPYYYSDDWLTSLSPGGEERNKPHADPGVPQAYLNALDRLVRDIKEASQVWRQPSGFTSNGGFCGPLRTIKMEGTAQGKKLRFSFWLWNVKEFKSHSWWTIDLCTFMCRESPIDARKRTVLPLSFCELSLIIMASYRGCSA
ncbi:hypothetical protein NC651_021570 [Populus alba x Populus x berolinensis]|nr:hypothetical protein NC651_021570 [Populus alba x Populus x berolinensis]